MSERSKRILISCAISLVTLVGAFLIIGRDAIFGDASLADVDFTFFAILVPVVLVPGVFLNVVTSLKTKDKK